MGRVPPWWSAFETELKQYVKDGCPSADSQLLSQEGQESSSAAGHAKLDAGEVRVLRKHVRDVIIETCAEDKLLEPFACSCLGGKPNARERRLWKDKAVMAVYYRCSWQVRDAITLVGRSLAAKQRDLAAQAVLGIEMEALQTAGVEAEEVVGPKLAS